MIIQNEAMVTDAVRADIAFTPDKRLREVMAGPWKPYSCMSSETGVEGISAR